MIERSALIGLAAYIGGIILGLILILRAFAFIGLCAAVFANKGDENAKTIAQQYAPFGVNMVPAPMDRISGWGEMLDLLGDPGREENPIPARLKITRDCVKLIECIPALQHNPNKPEDVLKWDVDEEGAGGDDPADAARYGLVARLIDTEDAPAIGGMRNHLVVR